MEVSLKNLVNALKKLTEVDDFGLRLDVPGYELDKMGRDFPKIEDRKREILKWWLNNDSNPTWEKVKATLRAMNLQVLANEVAEASKSRSQHEPSEEDLQRWEENFRKITLLDEEVEQSSEHLKEEWEKGENEWHEYLKKLEEIEDRWGYLVKTRQIYENFGNHLRYFELRESLLQRIERGKKLREVHGEAAEHHCGLQSTETELNEWEEALVEHASELQKHTEQMEKLGERFAGEAKDCKERLDRSQEQLQTYRRKISECRNELTKPKRQLQKYQKKLAGCEVSLWRCRNELNRSHSQITECIEGLEKSLKGLPLIVVVGGLFGAGVGYAGIGTRAAPEVGTEAAAGTAAGVAGTGTVASLQLGLVGMVGGIVVAQLCAKLPKTSLREKERTQHELIYCRDAIEKCRQVLQKSEKELESLQSDFRKLKVIFKAV